MNDNTLLINDRAFNNWSYKELYNLDETLTYFTTLSGQRRPYCTATMQLPRVVTKIWTTATVSEKPKVEVLAQPGDTAGEIYELGKLYNDIKKAVERQFAYGRVAIVPKINTSGKGPKTFFQIISDDDCSNLRYHNENGLTKYLEFTYKEQYYDSTKEEMENRVVIEKHLYDGVFYQYKKIDTEKKTVIEQVEKAQSSEMNNLRYILPQVFELETTERIGKPIWLDAYKSINDCNIAYSELLREMKLARRVVGVPMHIAAEAGKRNKEANEKNLNAFDQDLMMFTLLPGLPADAQTWQKFGGDFTPGPYLELLKFLLNQVSLLVGFGTNKLSEDKVVAAKTAAEVGAEANTMLLNADMIKTLFHDLIKYFVQMDIYMKEDKVVDTEMIYVTNSDSVFDSAISRLDQLYKDVVAGMLPPEYYIKEVYKEDAEEIMKLKAYEDPAEEGSETLPDDDPKEPEEDEDAEEYEDEDEAE